jgi:hypothetical protein
MIWPPDYHAEVARRAQIDDAVMATADPVATAYRFYSKRPGRFVTDCCVTYDPRNAGTNRPTTMPFVMFQRQHDLIDELWLCVQTREPLLIEKTRDMGATWACAAFSVWMWLFQDGSSVGWGSRKEQLVDKLGDPDSIFEKIRIIIKNMPVYLVPEGLTQKTHLVYMKCINPLNGSTITGEAGDNIGRGGRKTMYFKDESAHYVRPELIEAALGDNTDVPIDISSVNGAGNLFYKRRHGGGTRVFIMDWRDHPAKNDAWYKKRKDKAVSEGLEHIFAQEVDRDYTAAVSGIFIPAKWVRACIDAHKKLGWTASGLIRVGLDPADDSIDRDRTARTTVHGNIATHCVSWAGEDTSVSAQWTWDHCLEVGADEYRYESNGVGAGIKGKTNELRLGNQLKPDVLKWTAGGGVVNPDAEYAKDKANEDMFADNIAQAWWLLRDRCRKTYRMIEGLETYPFDELFSIDSSTVEEMDELVTEMSQPLRVQDGHGLVRREPKQGPNSMKKRGIASPNRVDSLIIATAPIEDDSAAGVWGR